MDNKPAGDLSTAKSESGSTESIILWDRGWPQTAREFELLVDVYLDRLVLFAFRRLGNTQDAEDVVQEVFTRAYADRFRRKKITQVGSYLYRMTLNACTDILRKGKRTGPVLDKVETDLTGNNQKTPFDAVAATEEISRAENLLKKLPKKQAEVIRLRVFDELRLNEIAEIVGCSIDTVNSRLRYGFAKLRKIVVRERQTK